MKKLFFYSIYVFVLTASFSQNQEKADSIQNILDSKQLSTKEQLESLYWLSTYSSSPADELKFGRDLLRLAEEEKSEEYIIKAFLRIGVSYRLIGDLDLALEYLFKAAEKASKEDQYKVLLSNIYTEISTCYTSNNDIQNALNYGMKTIKILEETDQKQELALNLLNIGYDYYLLEKYDSAIIYYNQSEKLLKEIEMGIGLAYLIGNRALVYWKKGLIEKAVEDLYTSIEMLEKYGDQYAISDFNIQLASIYYENDDFEKAILRSKSGLKFAREHGFKEQIRDASYLLSRIYDEIKVPDSVLVYQAQYYQYKDSIQNIETTQKLGNIRTQYEVGLKQSEVDLLKEKERNSKIIILSVSLVFFIALCLILLLLHYSRAIKKYNLKLEEQKNSLLKVNKTKDKYFSIISHDLRGPANVLAGIASVIKRDLENNEPEDIRDLIDNMSGMTEKLVKLLDNLLSWAILQQGNFPYNPKNISLASILKESVGMFADMASSKDIEISYYISDDIEVYVDKNSMSTIFRNIINNAVKFTEPNGKIVISTEKDPTQNQAIIKIKDNGIGMPANVVQSLFDKQSPKYSEGTEGEKGIGLGLQLVKDFIKLNNGSIEVDSKEDQGTEFVVSIPLARE